MKKILKKCTDLGKKQSNQYILNEEEHGVKLRLRGKGSGYKEGQEKQGKYLSILILMKIISHLIQES